MAYRSDSDGPIVDKGVFKAQTLAYCGAVVLIGIISIIALKLLFTDEDLMENAQIYINSVLASNTTDYTISHNKDTMTVKMWYSNLTAGAKKAYNGDPEALDQWETFKISAHDLSEQLYGQLTTLAPDTNLILMIVNEDNHSRSLLVYKNGNMTYDVVNDTKGD